MCERTRCELCARQLTALQRLDGRFAVSAEPPRVVEQLEALPLALTRPRGVTCLIDRDAEDRGDGPVAHVLRDQPEHALLELVELGEELFDDETVLVDERLLFRAG